MPESLARAARKAVAEFMDSLDGESRQVADGEWGMTVDAAGWPLHVGVALKDGLLRAQAQVARAGEIDDHTLLRWNRGLPLVAFSHTGSGEPWVEGTLPLGAVNASQLDAFLGLLVRVAIEARESIPPAGSDQGADE